MKADLQALLDTEMRDIVREMLNEFEPGSSLKGLPPEPIQEALVAAMTRMVPGLQLFGIVPTALSLARMAFWAGVRWGRAVPTDEE
ncbi:MAG: hypothetical protein WC683_13070 [bacterium]